MARVPESLLLSADGVAAAEVAAAEVASRWTGGARTEADARSDELAILYDRHAPSIHRFLCDLLGDAALAADATQETFVRAFRRLPTLDDRTHAGAWLFGIARNICREVRKSTRRAGRTFVPDHGVPERAQPSGSPEGMLLEREAVRVLDRALSLLSEDRRAVLLLRLDHGLPYDQIAESMGWSLSKVKVELFRAKEQLRAAMDDYQGGGR